MMVSASTSEETPGQRRARRMRGAPPPAAPAIIGVPKRSVFDDISEAKAIQMAREAARGTPVPVPVLHANRIAGIVQGEHPFSDRTRFVPLPYRYSFAWTSYDNIIASLAAGKSWPAQYAKTPTSNGVANNWYDYWPVTGNPTAGSLAGAANTAVQVSGTTAGALNIGGDVSPESKYLLGAWGVASAGTPTYMFVDRVLTYDSNAHTNTVNQAMTNGVAAQRYIGGSLPGLQIGCVVDTVQGATATNLTQLQYTDQAGNTLQSMPTTPTVTFIPSAAAPTATLGSRVIAPITSGQTVSYGPWLPLANGDTGAQLIANYTTSSANTGTFAFPMCYPLAFLPCPVAGVPGYVDMVFQFPGLTRLYDGAAVNVWGFQPTTAGSTFYGMLMTSWT